MSATVFKKRILHNCIALAVSLSSASLASGAMSSDKDPSSAFGGGDLADLSLESLMNISVYSASKSEEPWLRSAAAIFVLTGDEIRRAGVKTMPEALRLVPGVTVARVDAHSWAVTTRGFNGTLVDKLEVLLDGRSLYTPLFSGVYWHKHNILMQNIERIEVIRGPGASLWGANAVNGVINIVTRSAREAEPLYLEAGAGNGERTHAGFSTSYKNDSAALQLYGRQERFADFRYRNGRSADDGFESSRLGFRSDIQLGAGDSSLMLQGEVYRDRVSQFGKSRDETNEVDFILARWSSETTSRDGFELAAYVEESDFSIPGLFLEKRRTIEVEGTTHFSLGDSHELVLGASYRHTCDEIDSPDQNLLGFLPHKRADETYDVFIQDQIELIENRVRLTAGVKAEKNNYSGIEVQPTLRLAYTPSSGTTLWGAVSKAVRIPTRLDENILIFAPSPAPAGTVIIAGSPNFDSEKLVALEFGFRQRYSDDLTLDVALYRNTYDELRGLDFSVFPAEVSNEGEGDSSGVEVSIQWNYSDAWVHRVSYAYQHIDYHAKRGSTDTSIKTDNRNDPRHQGMLHSSWQATDALGMDMRLRNVSKLPDRKVDGYTELDLSVSWQVDSNLRLTLLGQNLLDKAHPEFSTATSETEVHRAVVFGLEWTY